MLQAEDRAASSTKPKVEKATLIALLRETATEVKAALALLDEAARLKTDAKEGAAPVRSGVPHLLRIEMREIEARLLAKHGVSREDVDAAMAYYAPNTAGALTVPTNDREVADAALSVKTAVGAVLLTKSAVLHAMSDAFAEQELSADELVETVMRATGGSFDPDNPMVNNLMQQVGMSYADRASKRACGVGFTKLMEYLQREAPKDPALAKAAEAVMNEGQARFNAALNNALQARLGGGGMGMMGM